MEAYNKWGNQLEMLYGNLWFHQEEMFKIHHERSSLRMIFYNNNTQNKSTSKTLKGQQLIIFTSFPSHKKEIA